MKLNQNNLLLILSLIIVIKFVFYPIIDWQNEKIQKLSVVNKRLDKSIGFVNRLPTLQKEKEEMDAYLATLKLDVDTYQEISAYQLTKQKEVELLFSNNKLKIVSFNWQDIIATENGSQLKLMVKYSGKLKDFIKLHMAMSKFNRSTEITNLGLNTRGQKENSLGVFTGNIVFVFNPFEVKNDNI